MRRITILVILLFLSVATVTKGRGQSAQQPSYASMLQLITTPEQFDRKLISVIGFLTMEREGDRLFAHQEDAVHAILNNAIQIEGTKRMSIDREKLDMKYVKVVGVFRASNRHRIPFFGGAIVELRSCDLWSDPAHPISQKISEIPGAVSKP